MTPDSNQIAKGKMREQGHTITIFFEIGHPRDKIMARSHITDLIDTTELRHTHVKEDVALLNLIRSFLLSPESDIDTV